MSRLYFSTQRASAELRGWEFAHLQWLARGPARVAWDFDAPFFDRAEELLDLVPTEHRGWLHDRLADYRAANESTAPGTGAVAGQLGRRLVDALQTCLQVDGLPLVVADVPLHTHDVAYNTAVVAGSRPIQLAAKLGGYGAAHAYVEPAHRVWLATVIEEGLDAGIFREKLVREGAEADSDAGWRDVEALLRDVDEHPGPVVTSHSVYDEFPHPEVADWELGEVDDGDTAATWDRWYALPDEERWDLAVAGVRRRWWLRLAPNTLDEPTFGAPVTVYDLRAHDRDERVRRAQRSLEEALREVTA